MAVVTAVPNQLGNQRLHMRFTMIVHVEFNLAMFTKNEVRLDI